MAYLDDQEIETLPSPPITTETTATTTTTTVNTLTSDSTIIKSLFALAVFLSLSLSPISYPSNILSSDPACTPTVDNAVALVFSKFTALTSFIFSAITALALRNVSTQPDSTLLRFRHRIKHLSDMGFIFGVVFLLSAIVSLAEMKLGTLSCGSSFVTLASVVPFLIFVPLSLLFFMWSSMSACMKA
ncbi:hypothetical protein TSUD_257570 [Trifolium subterraneum]|uniref:Uncharacterized protein n=1 Tax=Trifolium subterraneum TaxID=3900 RepID=A0A2Z6M4J1_TRISU|nr:hypothetical protein TSUD_257570 [Trifolium subterraneum]